MVYVIQEVFFAQRTPRPISTEALFEDADFQHAPQVSDPEVFICEVVATGGVLTRLLSVKLGRGRYAFYPRCGPDSS